MNIIQNTNYLIVEEHQEDYLVLKQLLLELGIAEDQIHWKQYIFEIEEMDCDLIFSSLDLDFTVPDIISSIHALAPDAPIIVLSNDKGLDRAIKAIQNGAQDYLVKGSYDQLQLFKAIQFAFERNELNVHLNKTKKEFESLFQYNPIPMIVYNLKTLEIIKVNEAAILNYGFSEEEFKDLSIKSIRPPEEYSRFDDNITKFRASNQFGPAIIRHQRKNGEIIKVEVSVHSFDDDSNTVIASLNDVTEEVNAKQALSDSNERLDYVTQATSDIIYDWDLQTNKISWGNAITSRFGHIGLEKSNIQDWIKLIHPDDKHSFISYWDGVLSNKSARNKSEKAYRIQKADGSFAHVRDNSMILLNNEGHPYRIVGAVEDISERIEAEDKLRDSEEKHTLLFNKSPIPKLNCDPESLQILDVNEAAIKSYGYSEQEFKKLTLNDLMFDKDAKQLKNNLGALIDKEESLYLGEWKQKKSNGDQIIVEMVGHYFNMGEYENLLFSSIDVTDNVRYKQELKHANIRFEYVMKATYDVIWDWDIENNELYWGENFKKIFGHDPQKASLNFANWEKFLHPEDKSDVMQHLNDALQGDATEWNLAYRFQKNNGEYAYVEDKCLILRDENGKASRAIGAMQDITDQKLKEQQLELMDSVVKNSNDAILITEGYPIDEPGPRIIFANEAFYKNTGYEEEDVIGRSPRFLQGPKTDRKALDKVRQAMERKGTCQVEMINYTKSGQEFWVEFSIVPVEYEGKTKFISIQRDITDRKEAEGRNELFRKMNMEISKPADLKGRFEVVLRVIADYCDFELAEGWITNIDNTKISRIATYSIDKNCSGFFQDGVQFHKVNKGEGLPGKLWDNPELVVWSDLQDNPQFIRIKDARKFGLQSAVAIPIFYLDELIGAILLLTKKSVINFDGIQNILHEVSHRFGAELLRMKSEGELNTFFNLSPDIYSIIDKQGLIKKVNPTFTKLLGYTQNEVEGLSIFDITQAIDLEKAKEIFENILAGHQKNYVESRVQSKSGEIIWVSLTFTFNKEEELVYVVAKDITEQKRLEKLLQKSNELAKIGSWEYDLIEEKVYWSDTTRAIYEVAADFEPQLGEVIKYYEKESQEKIMNLFNQSLNGEQARWEAEGKLITQKGNEKWVQVESTSEWHNGKCIRVYGSIQDIHERKIAENKLYETNLRYQLATKATDLGIWDWNRNEDKLIIDDVIYELYGIEEDGFDGKYENLLSFVHPEDIEKFENNVEEALQSNTNLNVTYRVIHPDNSIHYLRAIAEVIKDSEGEPYRIIGINFDITEEIEQQEKLENAYKERNAILESITDGFFAVDQNWNVTYWNAAAEEIVSLSRNEIIGNNLWDVFAEVRDEGFYEAMHEAMHEREMKNFDQYYREADLWIEVSCFPRKDGLSVYFKDISEQKKQEQKILEMRNLQQYVINSTSDLIWAIDDEYRLILGNDAYFKQMKEHTGISYEIGKKVGSKSSENWELDSGSKNEWEEVYQKAFEGKKVEHVFKVKDDEGKHIHYQVVIHPIFKNGNKNPENITGLACFSRDLTERLQHIEAIEDQNERLREIAWMQSHVVRAPVARIMGLAKLILEDEEDISKINELLPHILDSAEELDGIIHQISEKTEAIEVTENPEKQ